MKKIGETGSTEQRHESSRPKHVHMNRTWPLWMNGYRKTYYAKDQTQTRRSTRQISRQFYQISRTVL